MPGNPAKSCAVYQSCTTAILAMSFTPVGWGWGSALGTITDGLKTTLFLMAGR